VASEWYFQSMSTELGSYSAAEMRKYAMAGRITAETLVRKGCDGKWVDASQVKGLLDHSDSSEERLPANSVRSKPLAQKQLATEDRAAPALKSDKAPFKHSKLIAVVGVFFALVVLSVATMLVFGDRQKQLGQTQDSLRQAQQKLYQNELRTLCGLRLEQRAAQLNLLHALGDLSVLTITSINPSEMTKSVTSMYEAKKGFESATETLKKANDNWKRQSETVAKAAKEFDKTEWKNDYYQMRGSSEKEDDDADQEFFLSLARMNDDLQSRTHKKP
jgi:hypothetical protein